MKPLYLILFIFLTFVSTHAQNTRSSISFAEAPFYHGVASGDPLPNQVIIWTKVTPPSGLITETEVFWQIATDTAFQNIVNFGKVSTTEQQDFTVKIDLCGLQPNTYYYYVFKAFGNNSVIGRTKTAPTGNHTQAKYAVASCSNYEHGFFNAYESMYNRNDLDAVIHLGDYYYEYESGGFSSSVVTDTWERTNEPTTEVFDLDGYRTRHSHYKLDNQLQLVHQIYPFITTWDDHETANDAYKDGAENHDPATEGTWQNRKTSSFKAYNEWMPVRMDTTVEGKVWRTLRYGNLLDLIIIDTRIWGRDEQNLLETNNPSHKLLGDDQFAWLEQELTDTTTQWKIICNQMMMAPLEIFGLAVNADQWDGYNAERNRLINFIEANNIKNTVVLTGDIHTSWVNNIPGNASTNAATEFVVTSVTSPGLDVVEVALGQLPQWLIDLFGNSIPQIIQSFNAHMEYVNIQDHGYMVFTVDSSKAQGDYVYVEREDTIFGDDFGASWYTENNNSAQVEASGHLPLSAGAIAPPKAPVQNIPFAIIKDTIYATMNENGVLNSCMVNVNSVCPNFTTSITQNATYGNAIVNDFCYIFQAITNYYGEQSFEIVTCDTASTPNCDTTLVIVQILGNNDIEAYNYSIMNDSLLQDCITFNDLTTTIDSISFFGGAASGNLSFDINNCIVFNPDSNFCGVDEFTVFACDNNGICDTVVLNFIIDGSVSTQIVNLYGEDEELLSNCINYDELVGNIVSKGMIYTAINGNALEYNDTCLSYKSIDGFNGTDTLKMFACDDFIPQKCDTILYFIHITTPPKDTTVSPTDTTIAIKELENNEFTVLGVYPNPFDIEILIQYYKFAQNNISLKLYDARGKMIYNKTINDNSIGLKYAKLNTENIARGSYLLEINNGKFTYFKKLLK